MSNCPNNVELLTQRMAYALLVDDIDAYLLAVSQLHDCPECLRKVVYEVTRHWAGCMALSSGGRDKAADELLNALGRVLMPHEHA